MSSRCVFYGEWQLNHVGLLFPRQSQCDTFTRCTLIVGSSLCLSASWSMSKMTAWIGRFGDTATGQDCIALPEDYHTSKNFSGPYSTGARISSLVSLQLAWRNILKCHINITHFGWNKNLNDCPFTKANFFSKVHNNKVDVLHVRLTDLHAAHQNLPYPPNRTLPLKQYQYQDRLS